MAICIAMERVCEYSSSEGGKYRPLVIHSTFRLMSPIVIINGNEHLLESWEMMDDCTCVFDLRETKLKNDLDEELVENEWNHAEVTCRYVSLGQTLIKHGIHVFKKESSVEEIRFTDPSRKRNLDMMNSIAQDHNTNSCWKNKDEWTKKLVKHCLREAVLSFSVKCCFRYLILLFGFNEP